MRTRPTLKGGLLILFGLAFFAVGTNISSGWLLMLASFCFAAPILSAVISLAGVRGMRIDRDPIVRGQVGIPLEYELTMRPRSGARIQLVVRDSVEGASPAVSERVDAVRPAVARINALPATRGYYLDPGVEVECSAPFGFWTTARRMRPAGAVEIAPSMPAVRAPWRPAGEDPLSEGLTEPPRRGIGLDFLGVREYQRGDSFRHIHWAASARRDELVVREYQQEGVSPIVVVPDLRSPGAETERAIGIAGSLVKDAISRNNPVWIALAGGKGAAVLESPHPGALASALARAEAGCSQADQDRALGDPRMPRSCLFVVVGGPSLLNRPPATPAGTVFVVAASDDEPALLRGRPPGVDIWFCPLEGDACLTALSPASAA